MNQVDRGEWISDSDVDGWDSGLMACITRWLQLHDGHTRGRVHMLPPKQRDYSTPGASNHENCSFCSAVRVAGRVSEISFSLN